MAKTRKGTTPSQSQEKREDGFGHVRPKPSLQYCYWTFAPTTLSQLSLITCLALLIWSIDGKTALA